MPFTIHNITVGPGNPLLVIAGPCVIESEDLAVHTARQLSEICGAAGLPLIFKSSFDKANRTSVSSFRGPGIETGLRILSDIKSSLGIPVLSDIHTPGQADPAGEVLDVIQIPAFLCRQTDLLVASARTGRAVNVKKGQFLAPWDMHNIIGKVTGTGNMRLLLTERGTFFGYNNLVVDFRSFPLMRATGFPVVFDVTHSLQLPGGQGTSSGGQREFAEPLARAAAAAGIDGIFMEVHPEPDRALCDGPNMIPLDRVAGLLQSLKAIHELIDRSAHHAGN